MKSETHTVESGKYTRVTIRKGKKRKQKTVRYKKNPKKVVIARLNGVEAYVYPFDFPEKVFIGLGDKNIQIDKNDLLSLGKLYMRSRWYLSGGLKQVLSGNSRSSLKDKILRAYAIGLKRQRGLKK